LRLRSRHKAFLPLVLVLGIVLVACNRDPQVRKQKFYNHGVELLQKGKVKEAALEFRNAVKIDPNFAEAASVLAEIDFRQGDYRSAYSLLLQSEKAKPDYLPPHKGLAQIYRLSGKLAEAKQETDYILQHSPDDLDALLNLGTIQTQQKQFTDAEGTFNHILEIQPSHVTALLALASVKKDQNDLPAAERYLKLALDKNPRSVPVYLALLKFYLVAHRSADAEPLFDRALSVSNNNIEILDAQLGYYLGLGKLAEAERVARKIQSSNAGDPKYWGALADFYVQVNAWSKAETELDGLLQKHPGDPDILHKAIEVRLNLNDRKTAEALNEALLKKNPRDAVAHLVKGRLYLGDGDVGKAMLELNETQKYRSDLPALHYWYAQAHIRRGDLKQAIQALQTALQYDPNYVVARRNLAELQNQAGSPDAAVANARRLLLGDPGDVQAMLIYSQAETSKRNYAEAARVLKIVSERAPKSAEAHRQLGVLDLIGKKLPSARQEFAEAWELQPESKRLLEGTLMLYVAERQTGAALDFLQTEIRSHPNDALLYHQMAQVFLLENKRDQAVSALQKALSLAPGTPDSAALLADLYVADNKAEQANQLLNESLQKYPQDADLLLHAGMIFEKIERWDDARKAYERVLQIDGENAVAKNNIAWLLVEHGGNIDVALNLAQQAKEALGDDLQVTNTIGWIYYQKGVYQTAWTYLKESAQKDQKNAIFQYHLGMACWKLGRREEARAALLNALKLNPNVQEAHLAREVLTQL